MPTERPPVILWLLIPLILGWVVARYYLQPRDQWSMTALLLSTAVISTLIGVNFFYRSTSELGSSVLKTVGIQLFLAVLLWALRSKVEHSFKTPPRWVNFSLLALSAIVLIYTNAQQIANPDDDYWIHAPLQGLMRHDNFPPFNPFFSDIPMNGHYGRNLSIAIFSYFTGVDVFLSQHFLTSGLQVLTLWLFFSAFLASSKRYPAALLGSIFVFFGINAGGRGGLIDTMQNNNPFVHLYLAFLCYALVRVWRDGGKATTVVAGLALGSYAIVYETHFGLIFFTILGVTPILWARGFIERKRALAAFSVLILSLPLAFTQGGPLTDLLERKLEGREHTQAETLSKGMQNQAQVVKVTFPKQELFQILLETGEYQRTSHIYRLDTPLQFLYKPSTERGYAYIWSWDVLKIHFLPLYLVPWSAFVLFRRGSFAGLFMGAFGTIAFLVPALVNFGPIYESEYYRWEFAASLGFAAALGLALSTLLEKVEGRPFLLAGTNLVIRPCGKRYLLVGLLTLVNSWACLHFVGSRFSESVGPNLKKWLIFPSTRQWLASHEVLNFDHLDYEAATWLEEQVKPGDRLLTNFQEENNFSILYESTLTGITGARCVGHALPLEDEKIGTTPFRRSPAAQLFWQTGRPEPLSQLQVDWIFYQSVNAERLPDFPGATLVKTFKHGERQRGVYSVDKKALPELYNSNQNAESSVRAKLSPQSIAMRGGRVYPLQLTIDSQEPVKGTLILSTERTSDGLLSSPAENLQLDIKSTGLEEIEVPFVAPYDEGEYLLKATFNPAPDSVGLDINEGQSPRFRSEFTTLLKDVELLQLDLPEVLQRRTLINPSAKLAIPENLPKPRDILACWAFYDTAKDEFDLPPGVNLKKIELGTELASLPCVTPEKPGEYRLSLYLSAGQGHMLRVLGKTVKIP